MGKEGRPDYPLKNYDELFARQELCGETYPMTGGLSFLLLEVNNANNISITIALPVSQWDVHFIRFPVPGSKDRRQIMTLNEVGKHGLQSNSRKVIFMMPAKIVNIPHNWDDYYGYRQLFLCGNLHGTTMYVKDSRQM